MQDISLREAELKEFLESQEFKPANIWSHKSKNSKSTIYKVPLNGWKNVEKWKQLIGFSNPVKMAKLEEILEQRRIILNHSNPFLLFEGE